MNDIAKTLFQKKRFIPEALENFGFRKTPRGYEYTAVIMDGDFQAEVVVIPGETPVVRVADTLTGEEYVPLRAAGFTGAYVTSVREACEDLLRRIAVACTREVLFASEQANRISEMISRKYGVSPDFPWEKNRSQYQSYGVYRHSDTGKWFALIMNVRRDVLFKDGCEDTADIINLKAGPERTRELCDGIAVFPGYHMNHKNWISVLLDDRLSDETVMSLVADSFELT